MYMSNVDEILKSLLDKEFNRRKSMNSRYSLRSFAQFLEVDASTLSKVISGQRSPSKAFIEIVGNKLDLHLEATSPLREVDVGYLSTREFEVISRWEYFAMIDLITVKDFQYDFSWISRQLDIKEVDARIIMEKLIILGFIVMEKGLPVRTKKLVSNDLGKKTNAAKKEYQRQLIQKALTAIDDCDQERKDITSISIAVDPKRMEIAKEKIKYFRRELCAFLEGGDRTEVYHLTIQLCPVKNKI